MMECEERQAAIAADSRRYNVFTFIEDQGVDDVITSCDDVRAICDDVTEQQERANDDSQQLDNGLMTSSLNKSSDVADLEFKVDSCQDGAECTSVKRKIIPATKFDLDSTLSPSSSLPDLSDVEGQLTPDDASLSELHDGLFGPALDWEDSADAEPFEPIPEYIGNDELDNNNKWQTVKISDRTYRIDMESIDQYKKVLSHGGYYGDGLNAIIVFTACYLPEKTDSDYDYIMDNLFLYVMSSLELLIVHDYMIVYFHSATSSRRKLPAIRWFRRCYDMIDRTIRKTLRGLIVVHPTLFLKTILLMMKPFVSSKFSAKVQYVNSLSQLTRVVPTEYMFVPDEVLRIDRELNGLDHVVTAV